MGPLRGPLPPVLSPGLETLLRPQVFLLRIIWGAMLFAVILYAVLGFVICRGSTVVVPPDVNLIRIALGVVALVTGLSSLVVAQVFPSESVLRQALAAEPNLTVLATNPQTGKPDAERANLLASLSPPDRKLLAVTPLATTQAVVRFALCETPAVIGFVLTTLTHQPLQYLPFGAFSLALLVLANPRIDSFLERASAFGT